MKLFLFITTVFSLELALFVSSQSVSDQMYKLIALNQETRNLVLYRIAATYNEVKLELGRQLKQNVIPAVKAEYDKIDNYIEDLAEKITSSGSDPSSCVATTTSILSSDVVPNITEKAIDEMETVYQKIASNIHYTGSFRLQVISNEVNSISSDFSLCMRSEAPEYCNRTLSRKIEAKLEELPKLFSKEVSRTTVALKEQVVNYETTIEDYVQEVITVTKPYLLLLESCISVLLTSGW